MKKIYYLLFIVFFYAHIIPHPPKIIGLLPARNERIFIEQCLKGLAPYVDAIVYLDDCSTDESITIVRSLAQECKVQKIITKDHWYRDEPGDKNKLLQAGRELGGTHFIMIDADEMFTANCLDNNFLRNIITRLQPGDTLAMCWIQLWRSINFYRFDSSCWTWNYKTIIFADDGVSQYSSDFIHTPGIPHMQGNAYKIPGYTHGLLHFQFVNWRNLLVKQAWYRCMEKIRKPYRNSHDINMQYAPSKDETNIHLEPAPQYWFANYSFFNEQAIAQPEIWREQQVLSWFQEHGQEYFSELDIWDIDWHTTD